MFHCFHQPSCRPAEGFAITEDCMKHNERVERECSIRPHSSGLLEVAVSSIFCLITYFMRLFLECLGGVSMAWL
jgi:hypothetical protein